MTPMKLLVRMPNWVGDAVLALPVLDAVRRSRPDVELWAAGRPWVQDLVRPNGRVQGVLAVPENGGLKTLRAAAAGLRRYSFDAGLLLTNSFASALLFSLAKIPERWGYARDLRTLLLTRPVRLPAPAGLHQVDYYRHLLSCLEIEPGPREVRLEVSDEEARRARQRLAKAGLTDGRPLVIFNPGASYGPAKRWPASRFAELGRLFETRTDAVIALVGAPGEESLAAEVAAGLGRAPLDFTGRTTLSELMAVAAQARVFVTNDTGPMHLANALGVAVVAVFGPTDPAATGPLSPPAVVLKKDAPCWPCLYRTCPYDHRCMLRVGAEEVFAAARPYL
jgi:heptosyltransferase-2